MGLRLPGVQTYSWQTSNTCSQTFSCSVIHSNTQRLNSLFCLCKYGRYKHSCGSSVTVSRSHLKMSSVPGLRSRGSCQSMDLTFLNTIVPSYTVILERPAWRHRVQSAPKNASRHILKTLRWVASFLAAHTMVL